MATIFPSLLSATESPDSSKSDSPSISWPSCSQSGAREGNWDGACDKEGKFESDGAFDTVGDFESDGSKEGSFESDGAFERDGSREGLSDGTLD